MGLDTVQLGTTGLRVSELAFGTWRFGKRNQRGHQEIDRDEALSLLDRYVERGGMFIDTADVYGEGRAEAWIGEWLEDRDREDIVIASKVYWPTRSHDPNGSGLNRKHVRRQVEAILDRLGASYLDVLYIHRWDDATPADELMRTLSRLVDDGHVLYLGASTDAPNAWRVVKANELAYRDGLEPFSVTQPKYNLVERAIETNYLPMCDEYGLAVVPWSPLAQGFLTGKYTRGAEPPQDARGAGSARFAERYLTEERFEALDVVKSVAEEVSASPAQVSIAWLLHHGDVTAPIVGARTIEQLDEDLDAVEIELTPEQFERLASVGI